VLIFSAGLESAQYHTAFLFQSWRWFVIFFFVRAIFLFAQTAKDSARISFSLLYSSYFFSSNVFFFFFARW